MSDTPDILKKIIARKHEEVAAGLSVTGLDNMRELAKEALEVRGFVQSIKNKLAEGRSAVIAEIKKASPSKGVLTEDFVPAAIARSYSKAGAAGLSVLTDVDFFQGSNQHLIKARAACELPVIRKDFIIDPYQVYEARAIGADCILLIAAVLDVVELKTLTDLAMELKMDVLVEVHNEDELEKTLKLDLPLVGINNRNLHTFATKLKTSIDLLKMIPDDKIVVTESGILTGDDVKLMQDNNINSFLVGEAFMRAKDPGARLNQLFGELK